MGLKENIAAAFIKNLQPTQTGENFNFIHQVSGAQTPTKMLTGAMRKRIH